MGKLIEGEQAVARSGTSFASQAEIAERLAVAPSVLHAVRRQFPVRWPDYYLNLIDGPNHPIARMGRPDLGELEPDPGDLGDPVADMALRPVPFLVRKHSDRVILLTTKKCHFYCRFCFRRAEPFAQVGEPEPQDWQRIFAYLRANPQIEETILSGGDPLTLSDRALFSLRDELEGIASLRHWRIHTRAPVHYPARVTAHLVNGLKGRLPLRVVAHFNHASEITGETRRIAELFASAGISFLNQAVLLRGVNATLEAQCALWEGLAELGIAAHYLHHPDRAIGNAAFRLSLAEGRALFAALQTRLDQPPSYVLDLPDGRGKVPIMDMVATSTHTWTYTHPDGTLSTYTE